MTLLGVLSQQLIFFTCLNNTPFHLHVSKEVHYLKKKSLNTRKRPKPNPQVSGSSLLSTTARLIAGGTGVRKHLTEEWTREEAQTTAITKESTLQQLKFRYLFVYA